MFKLKVDKKIVKASLNEFGVNHQLLMLMEEMGELQVLLAKLVNARCGMHQVRDKLIDEFADVYITLSYLCFLLKPSLIQERIDFKLQHLNNKLSS